MNSPAVNPVDPVRLPERDRRISVGALLPEKIPERAGAIFVVVMFIAEVLTGTQVAFATLIAIFLLLSIFAVNAFGGTRTIAGFCVLMLSLKTVCVSQVIKTALLQAAHTNLETPTKTVAVLSIGMFGMLLAANARKLFPIGKPILKGINQEEILLATSWIACSLGTLGWLISLQFGVDESTGTSRVGGIVGIARVLTSFMDLAVVAGVAHAIVHSRGTKSIGTAALISGLTQIVFGVVSTSKLTALSPFLAWLLTCACFSFPIAVRHAIALAVVFVVAQTILFPINALLRDEGRGASFEQLVQNVASVVGGASDQRLSEIRANQLEWLLTRDRYLYFRQSMGIIDRAAMIEPADELISATDEIGFFGWPTIVHGFQMLLPRVIYPDKPIGNTGNQIAYEMGMLNSLDQDTQVAFGFLAESYATFGWIGSLITPFVLMLLFGLVYGKMVDTATFNIWGVFLMMFFQHAFVEASISVMIQTIVQAPVVLALSYVFISKLAKAVRPWI